MRNLDILPLYVFAGQPEDYCIGDLSTSPEMFGVISSILLVIEPNQALYDTLQEYFGAWIYKGSYSSSIFKPEFRARASIFTFV